MITLTQYQELVKRTANPLPREQALQNWVLGLCGEAGELVSVYHGLTDSNEGFKGEAGDVCYYTAMTANVAGITLSIESMPHLSVMNSDELIIQLLINAAQVAEMVKKHLYHDKPLPLDKLYVCLTTVLFCIDILTGFHLPEVMQHNIDKLAARHPNGFDSNHAKRTHSHPAY